MVLSMKPVLSFQCIFLTLITIESLARRVCSKGLRLLLNHLEAPGINDHLKVQKDYVNRFYDWKMKSFNWTRFLEGAA
jgi:hypothetical protein